MSPRKVLAIMCQKKSLFQNLFCRLERERELRAECPGAFVLWQKYWTRRGMDTTIRCGKPSWCGEDFQIENRDQSSQWDSAPFKVALTVMQYASCSCSPNMTF